MKKLGRVLSMINNALYSQNKEKGNIYPKATGALCCILDTCLLKLSQILIQGSEHNHSRTIPKEIFLKMNGSFIFVICPSKHSFIEPFMKLRHIKAYNHPADIKKVQNSHLDPLGCSSVPVAQGAFIVFIELVEPHTYGDKWGNP